MQFYGLLVRVWSVSRKYNANLGSSPISCALGITFAHMWWFSTLLNWAPLIV
jgi:hypothetical protein